MAPRSWAWKQYQSVKASYPSFLGDTDDIQGGDHWPYIYARMRVVKA
jgi:hypothetical protein